MTTPRKPRGSTTVELAPDVQCLVLSVVNTYLVGPPGAGDRGWALVDTGFGRSSAEIVAAAGKRFGRGSRPAAILLTHGHFDHVGSAGRLADLWDAPVYAHTLELPYLTGRSDYPPPDPTVGGGVMAAVASRMFPRRGTDLGDRVGPLPEDGSVPGLPGWRWIHTPGHTHGHVSFFRDEDRILLVGDAFVTVRQESASAVLTRKQEVSRPPAYFTSDWIAAERSIQELACLEPAVAGTGHGVPMRGEALRLELEALARNFQELMPRKGRYVRRPALADESGVVQIPPPVSDPLPIVLAGLGATALLGAAAVKGRGAEKRKKAAL
ncbi:MAG: MBL fold metallo-hydrolase [Acidobacteriota bacterium]